ncbi:hypothetical protein GVAV_000328 [Gurleya vavrai]
MVFKHRNSESNDDEQPESKSKSKRTRTTLTDEQSWRLQYYYMQTTFPDKNLIVKISREIGLAYRTIQIWFQNQRQRSKNLRKGLLGKKSEDLTIKSAIEGITLLLRAIEIIEYESQLLAKMMN